MSMWSNRQFWSDATWRAFRTWAQTMAATLSGYAVWLGVQLAKALKDPAADVDLAKIIGGWQLWVLFVFISTVAAAISLFQSIDRERAVAAVLPSVIPGAAEPVPPAGSTPPLPVSFVTPIGTPIDSAPAVGCGDAPR